MLSAGHFQRVDASTFLEFLAMIANKAKDTDPEEAFVRAFRVSVLVYLWPCADTGPATAIRARAGVPAHKYRAGGGGLHFN